MAKKSVAECPVCHNFDDAFMIRKYSHLNRPSWRVPRSLSEIRSQMTTCRICALLYQAIDGSGARWDRDGSKSEATSKDEAIYINVENRRNGILKIERSQGSLNHTLLDLYTAGW